MTLTPRQADVVGLIARGLTTDQIAATLGISRHTVNEHRKAAYLALGARNNAHATWLALTQHHTTP